MENVRSLAPGRTLLGEWCGLRVETFGGGPATSGALSLELRGDILDPSFRRCVQNVARLGTSPASSRIEIGDSRDSPESLGEHALLLEAFGHRYDGAPHLVVRLADGRPCFAAKLAPVAGDDADRFAAFVSELERLREDGELERQSDEYARARARNASPTRPGLALLRREERALVARTTERSPRGTPPLCTPSELRLLLRRASRLGETDAVGTAIRALEAVAQSRLVDHVSGGFFTSETFSDEGEPLTHKRLTTASSYALAFLEGFQLTRERRYRRLACESLDFVLENFAARGGGYFSGSAPEDPGAKLLDFALLSRLLGEDAPLVAHFYQLPTDASLPRRLPTSRVPISEVANRHRQTESSVLERLTRARLVLSEYAAGVPEFVDERVLVDENATFAEALLVGFRTVRDGRYRDAAEDLLEFLAEKREEDGAAAGWFRGEAMGTVTPRALARLASAFYDLFGLGGPPLAQERARALQAQIRSLEVENVPPSDLGVLVRSARKSKSATTDGVDEVGPLLTSAFSRPMARALREERADLLYELGAALGAPLHAHLRLAADERGERLSGAWGSLYVAHRSELWETAPEGQSSLLLRSGNEERLVVDPEEVGRAAVELERQHPPRSFVDSRRVPGRATGEATTAHLDRSGIPTEKRATLAGLSVTRVGLGTRAFGVESDEQRALVEAAIAGGQNVIDVSPAFAFGDAERLVGDILATSSIERCCLVVVGRIGIFAGSDAQRLAPLVGERRVFPLAAGVPVDRAFVTFDPKLTSASLEASLERIGIECLDVGLLPWLEEHETLERTSLLEAALDRLETERLRGRIGVVGLALPSVRDAQLALEELQKLAARYPDLLGPRPILALPLTIDDALEPALFDAARGGSVSLLALRPLTNVSRGYLHRLVDRDESLATEERFREARYRVAALEAEFETRFAPALRSLAKLGSKSPLDLGGALGATLDRSESLEQFLLAEATLVTPHLTRVLADLALVLAPLEAPGWSDFQKNYVGRAAEFLAVLRGRAAEKSRALSAAARDRHPELAGRKLPEAALSALLDRGAAVAFVGQRTRDHVGVWNDFLVSPR